MRLKVRLGKSTHKPRRSPRLELSEPARILSEMLDLPTILQDVSIGGACLRTHQHLRVGQRIRLLMHFGFNQRYEIPGKVVWVRKGANGSHTRYGVRFTWTNIEEINRLAIYVTERARDKARGAR
ncbi:MAG TPA: PilZ domain-containing protein [Candidatus Binatus sp.]|nr:PilZ domain-containing protein [Candidatus Binatus sp.]